MSIGTMTCNFYTGFYTIEFNVRQDIDLVNILNKLKLIAEKA